MGFEESEMHGMSTGLLPRLSQGWKLSESARHAWGEHTVSDELELEHVVEELFSLPEGQVEERRQERIPVIQNWLYGEVFGRMFCVYGAKNADGEWEIIHEVSPL